MRQIFFLPEFHGQLYVNMHKCYLEMAVIKKCLRIINAIASRAAFSRKPGVVVVVFCGGSVEEKSPQKRMAFLPTRLSDFVTSSAPAYRGR